METKAQEYARKAAHQRKCAEDVQALLDGGSRLHTKAELETYKRYHLDLAAKWENRAKLASRNN